jgi:hypothetical protein
MEHQKAERLFYEHFESIIERMPDDVLEATVTILIQDKNILNKLIEDEYGFRQLPEFQQ